MEKIPLEVSFQWVLSDKEISRLIGVALISSNRLIGNWKLRLQGLELIISIASLTLRLAIFEFKGPIKISTRGPIESQESYQKEVVNPFSMRILVFSLKMLRSLSKLCLQKDLLDRFLFNLDPYLAMIRGVDKLFLLKRKFHFLLAIKQPLRVVILRIPVPPSFLGRVILFQLIVWSFLVLSEWSQKNSCLFYQFYQGYF